MVAVPRMARLSIAWRHSLALPTASNAWSTPSPPVRARIALTGSSSARVDDVRRAHALGHLQLGIELVDRDDLPRAADARALHDRQARRRRSRTRPPSGRRAGRRCAARRRRRSARRSRPARRGRAACRGRSAPPSSRAAASSRRSCRCRRTGAPGRRPATAAASPVSGRVTMPPVQTLGWPLRHCGQVPQKPDRQATTWSPTRTAVTSSPTASTTPAPSWPSTKGRSSGIAAQPVHHVQVAVADAGRDGAHEDLAPARLVDLDRLDRQRLVHLAKYRGLELHVALSFR